MKQQFLFCFKTLIKTKKILNCIIFAIIVAFVLEFLLFKDAEKLYKIGDPNYGFFFISTEYSTLLNMFIVSLPLLSILPYGDNFFREKEFINQIFTRTSKAKYLVVNSFMAFVTGFIFIFIFVFLAFMYYFNYLFLRTSLENPFYYIVMIYSENSALTLRTYPLFTNMLFENPTLYIWIYIVILSGYAGLLSMCTYRISLWSKNKIVAYITPFALAVITVPVALLLPAVFEDWLPHIVFSPSSGGVEYHGLALTFWILLFLTISIAFNLYKYREDVLE